MPVPRTGGSRTPLPILNPKIEIFAVFSLLALFLAATCYRLDSPALIWDNLADEYAGARWAEIFRSTGRLPREFFWGYGLHHGRLTTYLIFPLFVAFGPSYTLVKLWPVAWALLTFLFTYLLVRKAFHPWPGILALLLLIIHPSIIGGVRIGNCQNSSMLFFSVASLYFIFQWWMTGSSRAVFIGMFLCALGMGTRLWFGWYLSALGLSAIIFRNELAHRFSRTRKKTITIVLAICGVLLGSLPILVHELSNWFVSFRMTLRLYSDSHFSVSFFERLAQWADAVIRFLSGRWIFHAQFSRLSGFENALYAIVFIVSLLIGISVSRQSSGALIPRTYARRWFFSCVLCVVMLAVTAAYPSSRPGLHGPYLYILYPLPQILIALFFFYAGNFIRRPFRPYIWLSFGVFVLIETMISGLYISYVKALGGTHNFSETPAELSSWLKDNVRTTDTVVVADYNYSYPLYFWNPKLSWFTPRSWKPWAIADFQDQAEFSRLRAWWTELKAGDYKRIPSDSFPVEPAVLRDPGKHFVPEWEGMLAARRPERVFLIRVLGRRRGWEIFDLAAHWAALRNQDFQLKVRFLEKDGIPAVEVYSLRPGVPASAPPVRPLDMEEWLSNGEFPRRAFGRRKIRPENVFHPHRIADAGYLFG